MSLSTQVKTLERSEAEPTRDSQFTKASQGYQATGPCAILKALKADADGAGRGGTPDHTRRPSILIERCSLHRTQKENCRYKPYTPFGVTDKHKFLGGPKSTDN